MNVLFLTSWYPSRYDAMSGLCVRKHAQAVRRCVSCVEVIYLKPDENVSEYEITEEVIEGVHEIVVYYPNPKLALFKFWVYFRAFLFGYKRLKEKPDLVQVNVLTRCGVLAWLLWRFRRVPYVVVEHWTRYLHMRVCFRNFVHKMLTQIVVKNAKCILPVSEDLGKAMQRRGLSPGVYGKINNVVDDFFYDSYEKTISIGKKRILHISCFNDKHKNITGILRSIKEVLAKRDDFELVIVGDGADYKQVKLYSEQLNLTDNVVRFVGEQTPREVCGWLRNSDFMVMFSNYENAPVVISEALAVGIPVVSTNVGGISEMIDSKCGILIEPRDESQLSKAIMQMLDSSDTFDKSTVKEYGRQYSFDEVGKHLVSIYRTGTVTK